MMTELLPSLQAEEMRAGLTDYLTTTFALADPEPRAALHDFLQHPQGGIFRGPYVRLRLPFLPADEGWQDLLDWAPPFAPYRHQAAAYARLTSKDLGADKPRPLPTIVTTGTGSGKTEAFLHPILDHVLRARREGVRGIKALLLYPMNALADDQAGRLARLITGDPALKGVTAGLYTGDAAGDGTGRTIVTPDGLITNRAVMRSDPPDILLTNYKMLDQLLLRPADQTLWARSARSLTYLVLDEFHTYDGAQGTDVAMLLRRLGLALRDNLPLDDPGRDLFAVRPLGRVTPVATSATLGDGRDPAAMLSFAADVFGEDFEPEAAITEARVDPDQFAAAASARLPREVTPRRVRSLLAPEVEQLAELGETRRHDGTAVTTSVVDVLYARQDSAVTPAEVDADLDLVRAHPDIAELIASAGVAVPIDALVETLFGPADGAQTADVRRRAVAALLGALSHLRLRSRDEVSVEVTLWIREVTRVDRVLSGTPAYRWSDDGALLGGQDAAEAPRVPDLPAIYCRACGRSGWMAALAPTGRDLAETDTHIRRDHLLGKSRIRALLHAPGEALAVRTRAAGGDRDAHQAAPRLRWLDVRNRTLLARLPAETDDALLEGELLPVLMLDGDSVEIEKASKNDECPSCGRGDQIRFLGSAIATELSVTLSTLFGDAALDPREKRALIFTDSVQDAAHRAGFVDARSHAMSLRAALRSSLTEPLPLDLWVERTTAAAEPDPFARHRLVPASVADLASFRAYWQPTGGRVGTKARTAVARRLLFDATLEVGLQTTFGRTLEATGSIAVHIDAGDSQSLAGFGRAALTGPGQATLPDALAHLGQDGRSLTCWVRGMLEHVRRDGGIHHEWLTTYVLDGGARIWIWGKRKREQGAPAFPSRRSAPAFPVVGGQLTARSEFVPVTSPQSWYARWTAKCLNLSPGHSAGVAARLLAVLADADVLRETVMTKTSAKGRAYGLDARRVLVTPLSEDDVRDRTTLLACDTCRAFVPVAPEIAEQLEHGPCPIVRCLGRLRVSPREAVSFYRRLYATTDMRRVDAREHTSLLPSDERRAIEAGFKRTHQQPGDPNVLVATPTLEMGIDIGDLTTVMLASLPDSVARYLQRVGRAGRLTGSSLALAYAGGKPRDLALLADPDRLLNGAVRAPATYLDAEEILRRQFLAYVIDGHVRETGQEAPTARVLLASADEGTFLGAVLARVRSRGRALLEDFRATFADPDTAGLDALGEWALSDGTISHGTDVPSEPSGSRRLGSRSLVADVYRAVREYAVEVEELARQREEIQAALPVLEASAQKPTATSEDHEALRSAKSASWLTGRLLSKLLDQWWIPALERRGLLPNYNLIDDAVQLDASISWVDAETDDWEYRSFVIERGSARALTELAPGASFYAFRLGLTVDGLELGRDASEVHAWVACPTCGFARDLVGGLSAPTVCPRCGTEKINDAAQRFEVVQLNRVFSDARRDDVRITDNDDDRRRLNFEIVPAADFDPDGLARQWSVDAVGLGVAHYRELNLRWFNVGRQAGQLTGRVAGVDVAHTGFKVCSACGKLDQTSGQNSMAEHRAWCPHRGDHEEHTVSVALARDLRTQGLALILPPALTADALTVPSLEAALMLGLTETTGGAPTHLNVVTVPHPVGRGDAGQVRTALLLHDTVPGGTGYLTDLASPERLWGILMRALRVVSACGCGDQGRDGCHDCLLPFTHGGRAVYRSVADRALRAVLELDEATDPGAVALDLPVWAVSHTPVSASSGESPLEIQFRQRLAQHVSGLASVTERPGPQGTELTITGLGGRHWTLRPQVSEGFTRPDFELVSNAGDTFAIYTDGRSFHAGSARNALADDARKRAMLRAKGIPVIAVTAEDLTSPQAPWWLPDQAVRVLLQLPPGQAGSGVSTKAAREQQGGAMSLLLGIVEEPRSAARTALAEAVGLLMNVDGQAVDVAPDEDLLQRAASWLDGDHPARGLLTGDHVVMAHRPHVVFAARLQAMKPRRVVLVLDDRPEAIAQPDHAAGWRDWLRLSNLLAAASPTMQVDIETVTSAQQIDMAGIRTPGPSGSERSGPIADPGGSETLSGAWAALDTDALTGGVRQLATELSARDVALPEEGIEVDGILVDLAWPRQRVAILDSVAGQEQRRALEAAGWDVVMVSQEVDREALSAAAHTVERSVLEREGR